MARRHRALVAVTLLCGCAPPVEDWPPRAPEQQRRQVARPAPYPFLSPVPRDAPPIRDRVDEYDDDIARVRKRNNDADLLPKGLELASAEDWEGAYPYLAAAYAQRRGLTVAANLGAVESKLERWVGAATHLLEADELCPGKWPEETCARVEKLFQGAREKVFAVTLLVKPPHAAIVAIDGLRSGYVPRERPLFLEPGKHDIVLDAGWPYDDGTLTVTGLARETATVGPVALRCHPGGCAACPPENIAR